MFELWVIAAASLHACACVGVCVRMPVGHQATPCATPVCVMSPQASAMVEDSETDSEEEDGGYDSDVQREKDMDYISKTYAHPARDATAGLKGPKVEKKPTADRR